MATGRVVLVDDATVALPADVFFTFLCVCVCVFRSIGVID